MADNIYSPENIKSISGRDFTRLRSGVYCGSTEYSTQLLKEVFYNSLDEHNANHGSIIKINIDTNNNIYSVEDEGQGFPVNTAHASHPEMTTLQASFEVINTSGKYEDDIYGGVSAGLNGIGAKLQTFLSYWSEVESTTAGTDKLEYIRWEDGYFSKREIRKVDKDRCGTKVTWSPDPQFFEHQEVNITEIKKMCKEISALCPNLYIKLIINEEEEIYHSERGILDLVDEKTKDKEILSNRFISKRNDNGESIDFCLTYTDEYTEDLTAYINFGITDGGVHITTLKSSLTRVINKAARAKGLLKEKEDNLTGAELSEGLVIVFNLQAKGVAYDAQTKNRVVKINTDLISTVINNDLTFWIENNEKDLKTIVERAMVARRAREAAKKAKEAARGIGEKKQKALKFNSKLADASSKNRRECEIYITEGDSASGNLKLVRDKSTQAILPVRGKILNVRKATLTQIQANAEIMTMIEAFGLKVDKNTMKLTFNEDELRYGKIIIMSDADVSSTAYEKLFA